MAIGTIDGAGAGAQFPRFIVKPGFTAVAGRPQTLWASGGSPGAGAWDATLNGAALTGNSVAGQVPRSNPASGNSYLARLAAAAAQPGMLLLLDRLWHNGNIAPTTTTAQSITHPGLPARDINGSSNGEGILAALEVETTAGAGTATPTIGYTNQGGTTGRSASLANSYVSAAIAGSMFFFGLQAGDTGIRSIQSITLGTSITSGVLHLSMFRIIAMLELAQANVPNAIDWLTAAAPRIFDNSVPFFAFVPSTTTAPSVVGSMVETQG